MKISFDIECSPAEARSFLGLPDLTPIHEIYLGKMASFVTDGLNPADFEQITRSWMPSLADNMETWRKMVFNARPGTAD